MRRRRRRTRKSNDSNYRSPSDRATGVVSRRLAYEKHNTGGKHIVWHIVNRRHRIRHITCSAQHFNYRLLLEKALDKADQKR